MLGNKSYAQISSKQGRLGSKKKLKILNLKKKYQKNQIDYILSLWQALIHFI